MTNETCSYQEERRNSDRKCIRQAHKRAKDDGEYFGTPSCQIDSTPAWPQTWSQSSQPWETDEQLWQMITRRIPKRSEQTTAPSDEKKKKTYSGK